MFLRVCFIDMRTLKEVDQNIKVFGCAGYQVGSPTELANVVLESHIPSPQC